MKQHDSNPFRSERLRPGAIDYLFANEESIESLIARLQQNHWRGEIIGPHGAGKSTLVQSLLPGLQALGCEVKLVTFQGGQCTTSLREVTSPHGVRWYIVIVDGFEQLSRLARARWKLYSRLTGRGLIVTAHQPMGLPLLYRTCVTPKLAEQIVEQIAGDAGVELNAKEALQTHQGNMRDVLFAMYDAYESQS